MSTNNPAETETAFLNLIDRETEDTLDPGIRLFDARMSETESFINEKGGMYAPGFHSALDGLNDEWRYHDDVATVTGRVYLADADIREAVPDSWPDPGVDPNGNLFYILDAVELRSRGIVSAPQPSGTDESASPHSIKLGYGFSEPRDDLPDYQYVVYPGEAFQHVYSTPSIEAIDLRLHRDWPEAMKLVDHLILDREREVFRLPKRLLVLTRRLQAELEASDDFRLWLGEYIDARLAFDKNWPLAITLKGPVTFVDEDEDHLHIDIEQPHTEYCFEPAIAFVKKTHDDGTTAVHAAMVAEFSHPMDEDYTDTVIMPVTSIHTLRSTRRTLSLVEIALAKRFIPDDSVESFEAVPIPEESEISYTPGEALPPVKRQQIIRYEINTAIKEIRKARRNRFNDAEAAELASESLAAALNQKLEELQAHTVVLRLEGGGLCMPNAGIMIQDTQMQIQLSGEMPYQAPDASLEIFGYYNGLYSGVEEVTGEDDETYYRPLPQMIFKLNQHPIRMAHAPVSLITGDISKMALGRLDGTTIINPAQLQMVETAHSALAAFKKKYPRHPATKVLDGLKRIESTLAGTRAELTPLNNIAIFRKFSYQVASAG